MTDQRAQGEPGRKGDPGRVGDAGRTGDQGDTGRGPRGFQGEPGTTGIAGTAGAQGARGAPGVSLTVEQLGTYVRGLEGRYRRISRFLTAALVVVSVALLGTLAFQQDQRREAITDVCEAQNATNAGILSFLQAVSTPENVELGEDTFPIRDCQAEVRRLTDSA